MAINDPLQFRVATPRDVTFPLLVLLLLVLLGGVVSSWPGLMISLFALLLLAGWGACILGKFKVDAEKLTLVVYSDGQVRLKLTDEMVTRGILVGQQWCTRRIAILHIAANQTTQNLLVLSAFQQNTDDFRRLNVWLKQGFCQGIQRDSNTIAGPGFGSG